VPSSKHRLRQGIIFGRRWLDAVVAHFFDVMEVRFHVCEETEIPDSCEILSNDFLRIPFQPQT